MDNGGAWAIGGGMLVLLIIIGLGLFIFWLWTLIDAIRNPRLSTNERIIWVLVIVILEIIGSVIYLFAGRKTGGA